MFVKTESDLEGEVYKQVAVRVPESDLVRFNAVAAMRRMSREALLRECILEKIKEYGA